jgi:MFS family permease
MSTFALVSFVAGTLYERLGAKPILSTGVSLMFLGILLLSFVGVDDGYGATVPGMLILGTGFGLFISTITTAAVTSLAPARASLGGAILYMFQVAGGSVGLALTTTVFIRAAQDRLGSDVGAVERDEQLTGPVRDAFVEGMNVAFRVDAALALAGVLVTVLFVGGRVRLRRARVAAG